MTKLSPSPLRRIGALRHRLPGKVASLAWNGEIGKKEADWRAFGEQRGIMSETSIRPVILCGGSGTRLWPLSRRDHPKQFLALGADRSLLAQAIERSATIPGSERPLLVAGEDHRFFARAALEEARSLLGGGAQVQAVDDALAKAVLQSANLDVLINQARDALANGRIDGKDGAGAQLKTASNCKACHDAYRKKK